MARPQSTVDLMHVPTPSDVIGRLVSVLDIPDGLRALDPCCGEGSALALLNPKGKNYGIELERKRAGVAEAVLDEVLSCSLQEARVTNNNFGLILLNPPYDHSTQGRLESVFLDQCTRYLVPGGVLILIIKESMFGCVTKRLMRDYEPLGHWRFPDSYYDGPKLAFKQTCLVLRKLPVPSSIKDVDAFSEHALKLGSLEYMPDTFDTSFSVPIGRDPKIFLPGSLGQEDLARLLSNSSLGHKRMVRPPDIGCGSPPLPLKQGHISLVLASGLVDGVYGDGETLHVAKGTVVRKEKVEWKDDLTVGGNPAAIKLTTDYFAIVIRAILPCGNIVEMSTGCDRDVETEE